MRCRPHGTACRPPGSAGATNGPRACSAPASPGDALASALADAGAAGVVTSLWSQGWGVDKIFGTRATKAPVVDVSCEDYGLLFRLAERKQSPVVRLEAQSEALGEQPVFNTIAEIRGSEKPDEYVMLSAHFDSWDGASGATDNGTGTITMLEAARLLSIAYPKPKRTIIIGHWSGEEQGLNGSRAWAADHPEVVQHLQALFNQDNGTGRIQTISTQGLTRRGRILRQLVREAADGTHRRHQAADSRHAGRAAAPTTPASCAMARRPSGSVRCRGSTSPTRGIPIATRSTRSCSTR